MEFTPVKILNWLAYLSWALAAISLVLAFVDRFTFPFFIGLSASIAISGILFFAVSRIIFLLTDIRDALAPKAAQPERATVSADVAAPAVERTTASSADIAAELKSMRAKLT